VVARIQAAVRGQPERPPPWPVNLQNDDELNGWFYEHNHERPASAVLADTDQLFQRLFAVLDEMPNDTRVEIVRTDDGREFYPVWIGGKRYPICEFFDHFRDDHEQGIRAWLAKQQ